MTVDKKEYRKVLYKKLIFNLPIDKRFKCKKCGNCCYQKIPVVGKEIKNKKFRLKREEDKNNLYNKYYFGSYMTQCEFQNDTCSIYKERPSACKLYPFVIKNNLAKGKYPELIPFNESCPGWEIGTMKKEDCKCYVVPAKYILKNMAKRIGKKVWL